MLIKPNTKGLTDLTCGMLRSWHYHPFIQAAQAHVGDIALHHGDIAGATAAGQPVELIDHAIGHPAEHHQRRHTNANPTG